MNKIFAGDCRVKLNETKFRTMKNDFSYEKMSLMNEITSVVFGIRRFFVI